MGYSDGSYHSFRWLLSSMLLSDIRYTRYRNRLSEVLGQLIRGIRIGKSGLCSVFQGTLFEAVPLFSSHAYDAHEERRTYGCTSSGQYRESYRVDRSSDEEHSFPAYRGIQRTHDKPCGQQLPPHLGQPRNQG